MKPGAVHLSRFARVGSKLRSNIQLACSLCDRSRSLEERCRDRKTL
jgi:hypothetical protein